ncbi:uncharacterized protein LOC113280054 [Papaver somniferum]|uniref:uncharacterized protein LOC113280054 n=1 Tax=Papaver somniferum TaxID=3469 RepID=UPI000E6FD9CD|nr:uncharacterized protein LOC113280054 [Papaver somniferum]
MPKNLGKLRVIQEDYIALEELQDGTYDKMVKGTNRGANVVEPQNHPFQGARRPNGGPTQFDKHRTGGWKGRDQTHPKKGKFVDPVYTKINTQISEILKKIDGQHSITYPWNRGQQPERTKNRADFCEFHQFQSHTTDSCRDLKKVLQDMINKGKLLEYIAQPTVPPATGAPIHHVEMPREAQYLGCNTILHSAITTPIREGNITGRIRKRNSKGEEVFSVAKEPPMEEWMKIPIIFSASETPEGGHNHNDPVVVMMAIALPEIEGEEARNRALPWAMPKILIDGGSSVEILFYETFKQMSLQDECLIPSTYNIFGFNGSLTRPRGEITLEIRVGRILTLTTFCVVDVLSPYTSIVGRSWVHGIKEVASTYHQRLRFPTHDGVAEIVGDSGEAKYCYKMDVQNGENKINSPKAQERIARVIDNSTEAHNDMALSDASTHLTDAPSS